LALVLLNIDAPSPQRALARTGGATPAWGLTGYAIVAAALLVPPGRLAHLAGRKRLFIAGLVIFVLASALCAAAPGAGWLIAARVLQAISQPDRKSTRLNSSHGSISYAVFCLKKKKQYENYFFSHERI